MERARRLNQYDALKLLALLTMTIDHVGFHFWPEMGEWRVIGRLAMPIFCFLVGYNKHYAFRGELLLAALLMSGLEYAFFHTWQPNILWGLLLARLFLQHYSSDALRSQCVMTCVICLLFWLPGSIVLNYGTGIFLWALAGRAVREIPGSWQTSMYIGAAWLSSVASVSVMFAPQIMYIAAAALLLTGLTFRLARFTNTPWTVPQPVQKPLLVLSQHALLYYVVHRAVLMVASAALV